MLGNTPLKCVTQNAPLLHQIYGTQAWSISSALVRVFCSVHKRVLVPEPGVVWFHCVTCFHPRLGSLLLLSPSSASRENSSKVHGVEKRHPGALALWSASTILLEGPLLKLGKEKIEKRSGQTPMATKNKTKAPLPSANHELGTSTVSAP